MNLEAHTKALEEQPISSNTIQTDQSKVTKSICHDDS